MRLLWNDMYPQSELDNYKLQVDLLQQKLKQSEENRQQLQKELQQILQRRSEHDKSVRSKIRQKYQSFLDEQERRNERNKVLMQMLERIDQQSAALSARSERLKMMKLQYERYFAKLMQTQTVRCIQNTGLTTGLASEVMPIAAMPTTTQIPVLLPTVEPQQPTIMLPAHPAAAEEQKSRTTSMTTTPSIQTRTTKPHEVVTSNESTAAAVLTPRMWTFAMATPTPAGLLLTGTPTAALGGTPLPTTVQYPLGYGTVLQQPLQQQQQQQQFHIPGTKRFRNRYGFSQGPREEMDEKMRNDLYGYGAMNNDFPTDTRDAATSTRSGNVEKGTGKSGSSETEPSTYATTAQQTDVKALDNLPGHQLDLEIKISEQSVLSGANERSRDINKITNSFSEVQLEDLSTFDDPKTFTVTSDNFENPITTTRASENFEETNFGTRNFFKPENSWEKRGPTGLHSAEEHMRKIAEIDRRYGTADIGEKHGETNRNEDSDNNNGTYSGFKRFSEIVNSTLKTNVEALQKPIENMDTQSWQSHANTEEYAPNSTNASISAAPKPVSIDNIENAIYGELVTPQLSDSKSPTIRNAAQGFFTELLDQQDPKGMENSLQETNIQEPEISETDILETTIHHTTNKDDTTLGYANYSTSIEGSESSNRKIVESDNKTPVSSEIAAQNPITYDTTNTELYPQTTAAENVYDTAEITNAYVEYPTEQNIEQTNAVDSNTANQQLQGEQEDYAQQGYENYDASQYENYDPNAYPGYIYDEATGQYAVDPQYVAPEGSTSEVPYATQKYNEQLPQEQLVYQENTGQGGEDVNYAYEDSTYPKVAALTPDANAATTPSVIADVPTPPTPTAVAPLEPTMSLESAVESAPKVVKPTSILATADKNATQGEAQKKKKRVNFVDSSETDDSSSVKATGTAAAATAAATLGAAAAGSESDFDFSSGAETSVG